MEQKDNKSPLVEFDVPFKTLLKIAAWALLIFLIAKLITLITLIFLSVMISVSLEPVVVKLKSMGLRHSFAVTLVALTLFGLLGLCCFYLFPAITNQMTAMIKDFPALKTDILERIPNDSILKSPLKNFLNSPKIPSTEDILTHALAISNYVFTGLSEFLIVFIFSIYLLVDGENAYRWFKDFFQVQTRAKIQKTSQEVSKVFLGYISGQAVTSVLSGIYSYAVLSLLDVPAALTLAVIAGLLDVLPVLGFFIAVVPAMLLALTVSPVTALYVLGLYILYHVIENYLIVPYVYGNRLEVSSLVVLVALLFAGTVGGVLGAIAILPIVASYPILEKIWLGPYLGRKVIEKHAIETETHPT